MIFFTCIFPATVVAVCCFAEALTAFDIGERYIREAQRVTESADAIVDTDEKSFHRKVNLVFKLQAAAFKAVERACPRTHFMHIVPSMDAFSDPYEMVNELYYHNDEIWRFIRGCGAISNPEEEEELPRRRSSRLR